MKKHFFATPILLALLLGVPAGIVSAKTLLLDDQDNNSHLCLNPGDTILLKLKSNVTTGYSWSVTSATGAVEQVSSDREGPADAPVGASGFQIFKFTAKSSGEGALELKYFRPFEKDKPAAKTFSVSVKVTAK
jgi:predicted secreted protein